MFAGWRRLGQSSGAAHLYPCYTYAGFVDRIFLSTTEGGGRGLQLRCVALRRDVFLLFSLVSCGVCGKRSREMMLGTRVWRPARRSPFKRLNRTGNKEEC
jgi:hypothetical protein